ncbi:MAG: phosphate ABC transporter ATP-binding protein [Deltaproteobacteria bacterium]|nr:phosphate ABC transporter ATP-binding protein [Deltaproteobacteria bacterium]MBM4389488.1 phosphate ABC transporter ATP-binding protein [Deltaproteobacteria bacterium]
MSAPHLSIQDLSLRLGEKQVLTGVSLDVPRNGIVGIIGPAGAGKSSLLTCFNRTVEQNPLAHMTGRVVLDGEDVRRIDTSDLRRRVAMVLPLPVGLPMSVYDNVAFAPRMAGVRRKAELDQIVERCLVQSALWDEVKDRLDMLGTRLSGGQQQRLTLARALSTDPEILCLDEFSIAIDPVTTMRIEAVLVELKKSMTIVMVTNLLLQARRIADYTVFMLAGKVVEAAPTDDLFVFARDPRTNDYLTGKFG